MRLDPIEREKREHFERLLALETDGISRIGLRIREDQRRAIVGLRGASQYEA